jgi:hypothetical protein
MTECQADSDIASPAPPGVYLADYEDVLQQIIPGAKLCTGQSGYGLTIQWSIQVGLGYERCVNKKHATEMMRAYGEQIRVRAIRELGVQPILDGYRAEAETFRDENRILRNNLEATRRSLDEANTRIDMLLGEVE